MNKSHVLFSVSAQSGIFFDSIISTGKLEKENGVPENGIIQTENDYDPRDPPGDVNGSRVWTKLERCVDRPTDGVGGCGGGGGDGAIDGGGCCGGCGGNGCSCGDAVSMDVGVVSVDVGDGVDVVSASVYRPTAGVGGHVVVWNSATVVVVVVAVLPVVVGMARLMVVVVG